MFRRGGALCRCGHDTCLIVKTYDIFVKNLRAKSGLKSSFDKIDLYLKMTPMSDLMTPMS